MSANNKNDAVSVGDRSTAPAMKVTAAVSKELFVGIDTAKVKQVVTRFIAGEGAKPAEAMSMDTLLARIARWVEEGWQVHCVYEAGRSALACAAGFHAGKGVSLVDTREDSLDRVRDGSSAG